MDAAGLEVVERENECGRGEGEEASVWELMEGGIKGGREETYRPPGLAMRRRGGWAKR
jgi:hypothetical protein